jgi:alpha-galactosidase
MKAFFKWCAIAGLATLTNVSTAGKAKSQNDVILIAYGKGYHILFHRKTAVYDVYAGTNLVLTNASCSAYLDKTNHVSSVGVSRKYSKTAVTDGFGRGVKTVFRFKNGNKKAEQIFYTYPNRNFFITQIRLIGNHQSINQMIPVTGCLPRLHGNWRSLFVPFDNDTFISYDSKSMKPPFQNSSSEVSVIYNNASRHGFIAGSIEHEVWKTGVQSVWATNKQPILKVLVGYTDAAITRDHIGHGFVKGDTISSPKIFVGYFNDWRTGMEVFAQANRIAEPPFVYNWTKPTPIGWNSWGVIQNNLSFDKAIAVANFFTDSLKGFRTGGTAFIDLDSYWDKMVKNHNDFSQLKAFADSCLSKGLQPGIYWAPFTDWGWKAGPDRKVEGCNYTYGELWTKTGDSYHEIDGARAIDPTHPGTLRRIDYFIDKFKACGFKMIKIDFLGHAAAESTHFHDTAVTTGMQAYRKGMEYLINQIGSQMFIYAAISPSLATGRYVHSRRIACDAFKTIDHTQYTLNSVTYGWWQTYLYNYLDADHVVLATESDGVNRARFLSSIITGTCFTGDDFSVYGPWNGRAKQLYENSAILSIIKNGKTFIPVESEPGTRAAEVFTRKIGEDYYVAFFNYSNLPKAYSLNFQRLNIDGANATSTNLLTQEVTRLNGILNIKLPAADATILKITREKR